MSEGFIVKNLTGEAEVTGQQVITGEYAETIAKFDTVFKNFNPEVFEGVNWDTTFEELPTNNFSPILPQTNPVYSAAFSANDNYLAVARQNQSNAVRIYKRNGDNFTDLNTLSEISNISQYRGAAFGLFDTYLYLVRSNAIPYHDLYRRSGDTFIRLTSDLPAEPWSHSISSAFRRATSTVFSKPFLTKNQNNSPVNGVFVAAGHTGTPFVRVSRRFTDRNPPLAHSFTGVSIGTNPANTVNGVAFSNDNVATYFAAAHNNSPFVSIYKRSDTNQFTSNFNFTKLTNPAILPAQAGNGIVFSPDNTYLAVAHDSGLGLTIYKRNGDTFTKLASPGISVDRGFKVAFSSDGIYLAVLSNRSLFITIFKRAGDLFTAIQLPSALQVNANNGGLAFSSDGLYFFAGKDNSTAPNSFVFKTTKTEAAPAFSEIIKANNLHLTNENTTDAGYALEDGTTGETKTMMSLFEK